MQSYLSRSAFKAGLKTGTEDGANSGGELDPDVLLEAVDPVDERLFALLRICWFSNKMAAVVAVLGLLLLLLVVIVVLLYLLFNGQSVSFRK